MYRQRGRIGFRNLDKYVCIDVGWNVMLEYDAGAGQT
jgi:hypothetical protein